jgi:hypothetical protein
MQDGSYQHMDFQLVPLKQEKQSQSLLELKFHLHLGLASKVPSLVIRPHHHPILNLNIFHEGPL